MAHPTVSALRDGPVCCMANSLMARDLWGMVGHGEQPALTGSRADPAPSGSMCRAAWGSSSAGSLSAPGVSSQLVFPHVAAALAAATHIRQELHLSVLMTQSLFHVKSFKWLNSSMLVILPFIY